MCKRWTIDGFPHGGPEGTTADATFVYAFISSVLFMSTSMTPAERDRFSRVIVAHTITGCVQKSVVNHIFTVLTNEHYKKLGFTHLVYFGFVRSILALGLQMNAFFLFFIFHLDYLPCSVEVWPYTAVNKANAANKAMKRY